MDILLPTESDVESVNTIDGVIFKEILDDLSKVRGKASGRPVLEYNKYIK